jgi:hypothetical protein
MAQHERAGTVFRLLAWLGSVLKGGILGKSSREYMSAFSGSHEYWERVIDAQCGCHAKQLSSPEARLLPPLLPGKSAAGYSK